MGSRTASRAKPFFGKKPYQVLARQAFPLLVKLAKAHQTVLYSDLAAELRMPNPRNLNYVLGSIGKTLELYAEEQGEDVPPIQCLVFNKATGQPGKGADTFLGELVESKAGRQRGIVVDSQIERVFAYPDWDDVLVTYNMKPAAMTFSKLRRLAALSGRGGGESEQHRRLKEFVASNPAVLGLPPSLGVGETEFGLASGDEVDVVFRQSEPWVAAEVKSEISSNDDLMRGLFQCVKYQAVLEAMLRSAGRVPKVKTVLVVKNSLPPELLALKKVLGIEVIQVERPPEPGS